MLLLSQIAHWCCDGSFDVAPKLLKQLFTLNVILKGKFIILIQFEVFIYFNFK
jgi:hypothetical protein